MERKDISSVIPCQHHPQIWKTRTEESQLDQNVNGFLMTSVHGFKENDISEERKNSFHCLTARQGRVVQLIQVELEQPQNLLVAVRRKVDGGVERNSKELIGSESSGDHVMRVAREE